MIDDEKNFVNVDDLFMDFSTLVGTQTISLRSDDCEESHHLVDSFQ